MRREIARSQGRDTGRREQVKKPWSFEAASTEMGDALSRRTRLRWRNVDGSRPRRLVGGSRALAQVPDT
ncbi:hypothetical protein CDD80_162 [Ophiocordyceps camponoti-rufipedis]|uniref:Uncharacterized protein n=1 Tax=Ophiocordyceps camponoti-rufipedis TaxID=2004952 RepID=A0A2C5ZEJ7_9HYPO|nr:hypothetical protein CDD80_162 [Ophiocordyceps camponoti-rufipedis]